MDSVPSGHEVWQGGRPNRVWRHTHSCRIDGPGAGCQDRACAGPEGSWSPRGKPAVANRRGRPASVGRPIRPDGPAPPPKGWAMRAPPRRLVWVCTGGTICTGGCAVGTTSARRCPSVHRRRPLGPLAMGDFRAAHCARTMHPSPLLNDESVSVLGKHEGWAAGRRERGGHMWRRKQGDGLGECSRVVC